jgi:hypothetical protein
MSNLIFPAIRSMRVVSRERIDGEQIFETAGGYEQRVQRWAAPRWRYRFAFGYLRSAPSKLESQALEGLAARLRGRTDTFLWADPEDSVVVAHPFAAGDGATTVFQLQRSIVPSAQLQAAFSRAYWPVAGDGYEPCFDLMGEPLVYKDGALQTEGVDYTLGINGKITFATAPADATVLSWSGTHLKRCRFDVPSLLLSQFQTLQAIWQNNGVDVITVAKGGGNLYIGGPPPPAPSAPVITSPADGTDAPDSTIDVIGTEALGSGVAIDVYVDDVLRSTITTGPGGAWTAPAVPLV